MPNRLREDQHRARSQLHEQLGRTLAEVGHEWAAVPLFYAAYHAVRGALLLDPAFDNPSTLHAIHVDLIPDDRHVERHKGRRRTNAPREWGVNDLVLLLYPKAAPKYERLHQASNRVRYGVGLDTAALPDLVAALDAIREMESAGELEAPVNWPKD